MRGVKIHGVLLLVTLLWAFQTWTREVPTGADRERPLVWDRDTADVVAITYRDPVRRVHVSRQTEGGAAYLQGVDHVQRPSQEGRVDTLRYPLGAAGDRLLESVARLRVPRDLGALDELQLEELGLEGTDATLTVEFDDGIRELVVGSTVFGGTDRYALEPATGRVFVLPTDVVRPLATGEGALRQRMVHYFQPAEIASVRVEAGGRERVMETTAQGPGAPSLWFAPDAPDRADAQFGDFMDRVWQLGIEGFEPVERASLESVVRVEYFDEDGEPLGFVELFRDPAGELYLQSERTHMVARAIRLLAERVVQEVPAQF